MATALCAYLKPKNIFESGASSHFQKYFCTTQSLNMLYRRFELNLQVL